MAKIRTWALQDMVDMIVKILLNKFDCIILIDGQRGLGKSTLAYVLAKRISNRMAFVRKNYNTGMEVGDYSFLPKRDLLYSRTKVIEYFNQWKKIGIADEMINVTFNRDFYQEDQKNLIKMMNMNRDHCNLFIACVPQFQTMDTQMKGLTKIRLSVVRRGLAIIQTQNQSIYSVDKWDSANNQKIERDWMMKGSKNPRYTKLTTFRGVMRFPDLTPMQREEYEQIKIEERNVIVETEMKINKTVEPFDELMYKLKNKGIKNVDVLKGFAVANKKDYKTLRAKIIRQLRKEGVPAIIDDYFWEGEESKVLKKDKKDKVVDMLKDYGA